MNHLILLITSCALAATAAIAQDKTGPPPPPEVGVITVQPESLPLKSTAPGRIVASAVAEVRPQVNGIIVEQLFEEGSRVEKGAPLYRIDPANYEATVAQAIAAVSQARAQFTVAEKEAARVQRLAARDVATQQNLDEAISIRDVAAAGIAVAEAQVSAANIDLERTTIAAPLSGEIGLALTTRGSLVTANQTDPLAIIRNIDDVYVDITTSAARVLAWRRDDLTRDFDDVKREVTLRLADGQLYSSKGQLAAIDPQVDVQTGSIVIRTKFPNPDQLLLPGMYVRVDVQIDMLENVFLIQQQAISRDRRGKPTVLVVTAADTIEVRPVSIRRDEGSDWIVDDGLVAGDRVVIEGQQSALPGTKVRAEPITSDAAANTSDHKFSKSKSASGETLIAAPEQD